MDLHRIRDEVEICIARVRAIQVMTQGLVRSDSDTANAFSRVAYDAEDGMVEVRDALANLLKAPPQP